MAYAFLAYTSFPCKHRLIIQMENLLPLGSTSLHVAAAGRGSVGHWSRVAVYWGPALWLFLFFLRWCM